LVCGAATPQRQPPPFPVDVIAVEKLLLLLALSVNQPEAHIFLFLHDGVIAFTIVLIQNGYAGQVV